MDSLRRPVGTVRGHIATHQLVHQYGNGQSALRELNLTFQPGERIGLLGRPGSGKSTLSHGKAPCLPDPCHSRW